MKTEYRELVKINVAALRKDIDRWCAEHETSMTKLLESNDISSSFFSTAVLKHNRELKDNANTDLGIVRVSRFKRICQAAELDDKKYVVIEKPKQKEPEKPETTNKETEDLIACTNLLLEVMQANLTELKKVSKTMDAVKEELKRWNA